MTPAEWSRASLPVWALVSGLPHRARIARGLFMLQCFVDESGNGQGPVMVLAGLIADVQSWANFSDEWQECLDMKPRMEAFHMTEIFAQSWGDQSQARVARFHKIVTNHAKGSVIVSIPLDDYCRIFGSSGPWRNPYLFLLFVFIRTYKNNHRKIGVGREVEFIFDKQVGAMARISEAWEHFETNVPRLLDFVGGPPSFKDDKEVKPLQAADLLAWWIRRHIADDLNGIPRLAGPWLTKDRIPCLRAKFDAASLQDAFDEMQGNQGINRKMLFHLGLWP